MKLKRIRNWSLIFVLLFSLTSCEEIALEVLGEAVDCVFPTRPELNGEFLEGKFGEPYSAMVTASIKNTPYEDSFDYGFEIMGSIPEGVQYTIFDRFVRFSGTPQEVGDFRLQITVETYDTREEDEDGTCFGNNTATEEYVIRIQP